MSTEDFLAEGEKAKKVAAARGKKTKDDLRRHPSKRFFGHGVRTKVIRGRFEMLTASDLLGIYLHGYLLRFDGEDPDFQRSGDFVRERGIISARVRDWFEGDRYRAYRYVVNTLEWWKRRHEGGESFPTGYPSFGAVFGGKHFFKNYARHCTEIGVDLNGG